MNSRVSRHFVTFIVMFAFFSVGLIMGDGKAAHATETQQRDCPIEQKWYTSIADRTGWQKTYDHDGTVTLTITTWDKYPNDAQTPRDQVTQLNEVVAVLDTRGKLVGKTDDLVDKVTYAESTKVIGPISINALDTLYVVHASRIGFDESENSLCVSIQDTFTPKAIPTTTVPPTTVPPTTVAPTPKTTPTTLAPPSTVQTAIGTSTTLTRVPTTEDHLAFTGDYIRYETLVGVLLLGFGLQLMRSSRRRLGQDSER